MKLFIRKALVLSLVLSMGYVSCNSTPKGNKLNPHAFKAALNDKKDEILIDVRTPEEYSEGHLSGALNINWNDPSFSEQMEKLDKTKPVFIYCRSGGRSGQAYQALKSMGFKEVYDMDGGISAWQSAGLKTGNDEAPPLQGMNMNDYHNLLETDKLVLVDFYATWCTPCKKMEPFLAEIATEESEKLSLQRIDADKNSIVAQELNITGLPTILLYKNKKMVWSHVGYIGKEDLLKKIVTFN